MKSVLQPMFPIPVYATKRDSELSIEEEKDIEDLIKKGDGRSIWNMRKEKGTLINSNIFDTKLSNLKEFCEEHIKKYVEQVINPEEELDFYITQSWLNVAKPGESNQAHFHQNSIIGGVFYIATIENDNIQFYNTKFTPHGSFHFEPKEYNIWNSSNWFFPIEKNQLLLFPSWLEHSVKENKSDKDRISIAFNVFAKGIFGRKDLLNELIL